MSFWGLEGLDLILEWGRGTNFIGEDGNSLGIGIILIRRIGRMSSRRWNSFRPRRDCTSKPSKSLPRILTPFPSLHSCLPCFNFRNATVLAQAQKTVDWLFSSQGFINTQPALAFPPEGLIFDGFPITACASPSADQWSYNYGQTLGALAWMHLAVRCSPSPSSIYFPLAPADSIRYTDGKSNLP